MKFSQFAEYLQKLEETSKRLEITDILTDLIKNLSTEETDKALYLSLGYLKAPFESEKFNIAEKMMLTALEETYHEDKQAIRKMYSKLGDLGTVAQELDTKKKSTDLTISEVHKRLLEVAQAEGSGSQTTKVSKLAALLRELGSLSTRYVVRIVLGTTRLGFTELTIIDALSQLAKGDKSLKSKIEEHYNMHPDIGLIAKKIKEKGIEGVKDISIEAGIPIMAQKCQRLTDPQEIIEKMGGEAWAEYKFDGTRVQLHLNRNTKIQRHTPQQKLLEDSEPKFLIKTFTRNLEETTHQFPDLVEAADKQIAADSVILDGEAIGYDKKTGKFLPFQETIKRKRKYGVKEAVQEMPLRYFVFDLLYLNGKSLMDKPLAERRELLENVVKKGDVIEVASNLKTKEPQKLTQFFEESKEKNLEGLVIKNPEAKYQAGARSFAWIKLKKADTDLLEDDFDCVILGYYYGRGVRSKFGIGGFLAGVYNTQTEKFESITKVGTGLTDKQWTELKEKIDKISIKEKPKDVEVKKDLYPNVWADPKIVVVLKADEITKSPTHTAGYALRFPRFIEYRTDKNPQDATSVSEIKSLYKGQKRGYY